MTFTIRARFTARFRDHMNVQASTAVDTRIDDTVTPDQVSATWAAWAAAMDALSDALITGGQVSTSTLMGEQLMRIEQRPSGLKTTLGPEPTAWIPDAGLFNFGSHRWSHGVVVPAFTKHFFIPMGRGRIRIDEPPIRAFINLISTPIADGHGVFTDRHGRPLVDEQEQSRFRYFAPSERNRRSTNRQLRRR
jgi:hypothetical protein